MIFRSKNLIGILGFAILAACAANAQPEGNATPLQVASKWPSPEVGQIENPNPERILFVGNSYFYYNDSLHNHVQRMAVAAGVVERRALTYKSATIGGASLRDHAIDHLLEPANLRVAAPFEVVILQGGSAEPLSEERRALFRATATAYAAKVRAKGAEPVLYMTPAYVPPHRLYRTDMIDDIASLYVETGNSIDALVIPVGLAFAEAYKRRPELELHKDFDGSHPSLAGTYLAAATTFASLYRVSPVGNSYDYYGSVDHETAEFLQGVAWETVTKFYEGEK